MQDDNIIVLKSVYKIPKVKIQPVKDKFGAYKGGVKKVDSNGNPILSREERDSGEWFPTVLDIFELEDGKELDLSNEREAKIWGWVKHHPKIAESRYIDNGEEIIGNPAIDGTIGSSEGDYDTARYGEAEFYVYSPSKMSEKKVSKKKLIHTAETYIFGDSKEGVYQKARLLGENMDSVKVAEVEEYLLSVAEKTPSKIIEAYTGKDNKLKLMLYKAVDLGVISTSNGVYSYGTEALGVSEDHVIAWIKDVNNKELVDLLKKQLYPEHTAKSKKTK